MATNSTTIWRIAVIGAIAALAYAQTPEEPSLAAASDLTSMVASTVTVRTISPVETDVVGDSVWKAGAGSGFLVSRSPCEVWTNHHVVSGAAFVEILVAGRPSGIPARVTHSDKDYDFAIVELDECDALSLAPVGDSAAVERGDEVFVVGNPLGINPDSVTRGIVSHPDRFLSNGGPFIQTDAAMSFGNSGGALFDEKGRVIGINSRIASLESGGATGLGYALPINTALQVAKRLKSGAELSPTAELKDVLRGVDREQALHFGLPEGQAGLVLLDQPEPDSPYHGLLANDVIFEINGQALQSPEQGLRALAQLELESSVRLAVLRSGTIKEYRVETTLPNEMPDDLLALPQNDGIQASELSSAEAFDGYLGMTLESWTDHRETWRREFKAPVIVHVQSLGPAHRGQISSSQRGLAFRGPVPTRYQLDVKLVVGVVMSGEYIEVQTPQQLQSLAATAWLHEQSILLRVETYARHKPENNKMPFERRDVKFHALTPAKSDSKLDSGPELVSQILMAELNS